MVLDSRLKEIAVNFLVNSANISKLSQTTKFSPQYCLSLVEIGLSTVWSRDKEKTEKSLGLTPFLS